MKNAVIGLVSFVLFVMGNNAIAAGTYSGGTGDANDPYLISKPEDLNDIGLHPEY
jgi:hypothetical protein